MTLKRNGYIGLFDHQLETLPKIKNGCILNGGVGSGKSRTALAYYYQQEGGDVNTLDYSPIPKEPRDLYIITTARKRDDKDWESDMLPFLLSPSIEANFYNNKIVVDSWQNIRKYKDVRNAFFIFDEQKVVGYGVWTNTFLKITKHNDWLLLSATPGDNWQDYLPVFIANGFYKTKREFNDEHCVFARFVNYPKIERYVNTRRLERLREKILINMDFDRKTIHHNYDIWSTYDKMEYKDMIKNRWNPWKMEPMTNAAELCYSLRKLVNSDASRVNELYKLIEEIPKTIVFYNFDYELDILRELCNDMEVEYAEWNGHKHQPIPDSERWVYLVQYTSGAEGWNCIRTNTIIFYSQNYSYKVVEQAKGRIDRLNTPYIDLHYYTLKSKAPIDQAIERALSNKKRFNERKFTNWDKLIKPVSVNKLEAKYGC